MRLKGQTGHPENTTKTRVAFHWLMLRQKLILSEPSASFEQRAGQGVREWVAARNQFAILLPTNGQQ